MFAKMPRRTLIILLELMARLGGEVGRIFVAMSRTQKQDERN